MMTKRLFLFPLALCLIAYVATTGWTAAPEVYAKAKHIPSRYVSEPDTENLSEEALAEKKTAEKLDKASLLYTGRVVVDQNKKMLVAPKHIKPF
ncbi:MAG TPA: hypothetical protein PLG59_15910, partial [bacterium]|nr:hypothetical protein [bacterium]